MNQVKNDSSQLDNNDDEKEVTKQTSGNNNSVSELIEIDLNEDEEVEVELDKLRRVVLKKKKNKKHDVRSSIASTSVNDRFAEDEEITQTPSSIEKATVHSAKKSPRNFKSRCAHYLNLNLNANTKPSSSSYDLIKLNGQRKRKPKSIQNNNLTIYLLNYSG